MKNNEGKEKLQPTEQARKLIADATSDFLRTRMQITQEILQSGTIITMTFDEYIKGADEIGKDDRTASQKYYEDNRHRILVTADEIEELVELVRESLTKYSIGDCAYSGQFSSLIRDAVDNLEENLDKDGTLNNEKKISRLKAIKKWKHIAYGERIFAMDPRIEGRVSWGYMDEFNISDTNYDLVAKIGLDGTDKMVSENRERKEEDVLIASNVFFGNLFVDKGEEKPEQQFTVLLKKEIEGQTYYKAIYYDDKTYPKQSEEAKNYAVPVYPFNYLLTLKGLSYLLEDFYDSQTFDRAIQIFNRQNSITDEEKEKMEKAIAVAVEWWADAIKSPTFDNGDFMQSAFATMLLSGRPAPADEKIELFKKYLGNEIRAGLMASQRDFSLDVDYHPDQHLYTAATKANLDTGISNFPCKTHMWISPEEVSVSAGYRADKQVLYSASMVNTDTDSMDGENPQGPKS